MQLELAHVLLVTGLAVAGYLFSAYQASKSPGVPVVPPAAPSSPVAPSGGASPVLVPVVPQPVLGPPGPLPGLAGVLGSLEPELLNLLGTIVQTWMQKNTQTKALSLLSNLVDAHGLPSVAPVLVAPVPVTPVKVDVKP